MRKLLLVAGVVVFALAGPASASAEEPVPLSQPKPAWLTPDLEREIIAAGTKGVEVRLGGRGNEEAGPELNCLGTAPPYVGADSVSINAVSAGTCMVSPAGCTMNFVFNDGTSNYIGTAGHCVRGNGGRTVIAQVATRVDPTDTTDALIVTLAAIGKATKVVDGGIGKDFALVKVDPGWKVVPGIAGALGPTGVLCLDPVGQPVMHYGHGYVFLVSQGNAKFGEVIPDLTDAYGLELFEFASPNGFNWIGYGLPGDSGSGVANAAGLAVGDLTHGIGIAGLPVPGLNFGTDMAGIFDIIGSGYSLVTVHGRKANCANPLGV